MVSERYIFKENIRLITIFRFSNMWQTWRNIHA